MEYDPATLSGNQSKVGSRQGLSWEQVGTKLGLSWAEVEKLFLSLQQPKSMSELKNLYGWTNTTKFKSKYINPLIDEQLVALTLPGKPTSPNQKYYLTDKGKSLLSNEIKASDANYTEDKINRLIESLSEEEKLIVLKLLQKDEKSAL